MSDSHYLAILRQAKYSILIHRPTLLKIRYQLIPFRLKLFMPIRVENTIESTDGLYRRPMSTTTADRSSTAQAGEQI